MKQHPAKHNTCLVILLAVVALICVAGTSRAQQPRNTPNQTGTMGGTDLESRERQIRSMEIDQEHKRTPQDILAEINEDMRQLQTLRDGLAHATASDQQVDYKFISDSVVEIKKRSMRLNTDLALPQGAKDEKRNDTKEADGSQLQPGLAALNKLIDGFLHNPIFSDAGAPDPQLAAKAKRDLEQIITLSDKLRKTADKLNKSGGKTP